MKKKLFKSISLILLISCILSIFTHTYAFAAFETNIEELECDVHLVMSLDDGSIIVENNSKEKRAPSALLGIAVAITAIEKCENLETDVEVKSNVIAKISGTNTATLGLKTGEIIRVIDLLYGVMLNGASDAAVTIADFISGGIDNFVQLMNETAVKAGCENTNFTNVTGLDDDAQYTTAYDIALIAAYALKNSHFTKIAQAFSCTIPQTNKSAARTIYTTNLMMNVGFKDYYTSLAQGLRTGSTTKAGRCVITSASKNGYSYVAVVMGGPLNDKNGQKISTNYAFTDCKSLINWTFNNIKLRVVASVHQQVGEVKLNLASNVDYLRLVPESEITALVPSGVNAESVLIKIIEEETIKEIDAPVQKGTVLGRAGIYYASEEIAQVNLVAADSYERSTSKYLKHLIKNFIFSKIFIVLIAAFLVCILFYLIIIRPKKVKKHKNMKLIKGNRTHGK